MSTKFQWEDHSILVQTQPALKYLWLATETVVSVDGVEIGRSGGFRFTERLVGNFPHGHHSSELVLEMKSDFVTLVSIPYTLMIDGGPISKGRLEIENWVLFFVPTLILTALICWFATAYLYIYVVALNF